MEVIIPKQIPRLKRNDASDDYVRVNNKHQRLDINSWNN